MTGAAVVLTMLPSGQHVLDAYRGVDGAPGLLSVAAPDTMFLDCSTINVDEAREAAAIALDAGHRSVDAPVSGGVVGAEAGTLTFMVGALPEDFETVQAHPGADGQARCPLRRTTAPGRRRRSATT